MPCGVFRCNSVDFGVFRCISVFTLTPRTEHYYQLPKPRVSIRFIKLAILSGSCVCEIT